MKNLISRAVLGIVAGLCLSTQAATINGTIGFTGRVTLNTGSAGTATAVNGWVNPTVNGTSGTFSSIANGTAVSIHSPWSFNSGAVASFWTVGGFTFNLISSAIISHGGAPGVSGYVNVTGTGTVSGLVNGVTYNPTTIIWNFSTQDPSIIGSPSGTFTFSSSHITVPDGATTVILLGLSLTTAGLLRKRLAA